MPQQYSTDSGVLIIPGVYFKTTVQNNPSGLGTTGVLMLIGEADAGPSFSEEQDLSLNSFGSDQISDFITKYKSGPLVDGFRGAIAAANDPNIQGSFNRVVAVKSNVSTRASGVIPAIGGGNYATIQDKSKGDLGNLISRTITAATAEVIPSTGSVVLAVPQVNTDVEFRVNGGAAVTASLTASQLPSSMVTTINALAGVAASGGVNRSVINAVAGSLTVAVVSGLKASFTISGASYNALPTVGDIMYVPTGSPLATANEGTWVVTAASGAVITAYKLLDAAGAGSAITPPTAEGPIAITATTNLQAFSPVVISSEAGAVSAGLGKSLEIATTVTGDFSVLPYVFTSATASPPAALATFVSKSGTPAVVVSSQEYSVTVVAGRQLDSVSDSVTTGGDVILTLGYTGTTASAVIANGVLTVTRAGGSGADLTVTLARYPTINQLAEYISAQTGYVAAAGNATLGQLPSTILDPGTYTVATKWGAPVGRIKADGYFFQVEVSAGSSLIDVVPISPATALVGLPDVASLGFLSGGARGATTNASISAALDALQAVRGNFLVPLFSRDATSDIASGITDAASTYTIDSINTLARAHVLALSTLKRRRHRQAFLSYRGTFKDAKTKSSNMANGRVSFYFQDIKDVDATGTMKQFQPWMAAVKAASMQAAGFYRAIVNKYVNISGALQAAGDFNDQLDSNVEDALLAGLCPITRDEAGGFRWVSDQTTYTKDDNFVYNSIQAIYAADVIGATVSQRMDKAFTGQSIADTGATLGLTTLEAILTDLKRLKLIAASDDAPKGFRNATVKISGTSMAVSVEIKLAGAIYFIPIYFLVTPVQQSAG